MQPYLPLFAGFFTALALTLLISWPVSQRRTRRRLFNSLCVNNSSLTAAKSDLRHGLWFFCKVVVVSAVLTGGLLFLFYLYLAHWIFDGLIGGLPHFLLQKLQTASGAWIFPTKISGTSETETRIVPLGFGLALFLGVVVGAYLGSFIGRRITCRSYALSSRFF